MGWLLVCAGLFLAPALAHGHALGPYDLLDTVGVTARAHAHVHNVVGSDEIQEFIPWQALAWLDVRAGHLPLWNPYSLLGMPLAFNFEAAPFSLTVALGYAFPLALAHSATIAARLVLAGTGTYVLCRMLGLGRLASALGGTVFELSGAFTIWVGTYEGGIWCLLGWVLACSVAVLRRTPGSPARARVLPVVALAVTLALSFAAGEPQVDLLLVVFVVVFALVVVARGGLVPHGDRRRSLLWHAMADHGLALGGACALVAAIYLPSVQLLLGSARTAGPGVSALAPRELVHLLFSSYDGVPTNLASVVGPNDLYVSMIYVGAIGLVLALCGLAWLRTRAEVTALTVLAGALGLALFAPPVVTAMAHLPYLRVFRLDLATPLLDFSLAVLAAFGLHALGPPRAHGDRSELRAARVANRLLISGTAFLTLVLGALWVLLQFEPHLHPAQRSVRAASFEWPAICVASLAVYVVLRSVVLSPSGRVAPLRPRGALFARTPLGALRTHGALGALGALVALQAACCITSGAWFVSSTKRPFAPTAAVTALWRAANGGLVGMGGCTENAFPSLGIMPEANAPYGLAELTGYDPIIPKSYYVAVGRIEGTSTRPLVPHVLCPSVGSVHAARQYGVALILEPPGVTGPKGTHRVGEVHGEGMFLVPESGRATLGNGRVEPSSTARTGTLRVQVDTKAPSALVLRVTGVPGWQATVDGRPIALHHAEAIELSTHVPAGRHTVTLRYWPRLFGVGLWISLASALALLAAAAWATGGRIFDAARLRRRGSPT